MTKIIRNSEQNTFSSKFTRLYNMALKSKAKYDFDLNILPDFLKLEEFFFNNVK